MLIVKVESWLGKDEDAPHRSWRVPITESAQRVGAGRQRRRGERPALSERVARPSSRRCPFPKSEITAGAMGALLARPRRSRSRPPAGASRRGRRRAAMYEWARIATPRTRATQRCPAPTRANTCRQDPRYQRVPKVSRVTMHARRCTRPPFLSRPVRVVFHLCRTDRVDGAWIPGWQGVKKVRVPTVLPPRRPRVL